MDNKHQDKHRTKIKVVCEEAEKVRGEENESVCKLHLYKDKRSY